MNKIEFSHNWNNKLSLDAWTTIRKWTADKEDYYISKETKVFDVYLTSDKQRFIKCRRTLMLVERRLFEEIPYGLLVMDTGNPNPIPIFRKFGITEGVECLILSFIKEDKG